MAIAFDTTTDSGEIVSDSSATWAHTVTGSDTILIVDVYSVYSTTTGVTYNGTAMTKIVEQSASTRYCSSWYLIAPTTGANNVVVSLSAAANFRATASSYTGVAQTSPIDSFNSGAGTSTTITISTTVVASNCWTHGFNGVENFNNSTIDSTSNKTDRSHGRASNYRAYCTSDSNGVVSTGANSFLFTATGAGGWANGAIAFSLAPKVASGPANLKSRSGNLSANIKSNSGNLIANMKNLSGNV